MFKKEPSITITFSNGKKIKIECSLRLIDIFKHDLNDDTHKIVTIANYSFNKDYIISVIYGI